MTKSLALEHTRAQIDRIMTMRYTSISADTQRIRDEIKTLRHKIEKHTNKCKSYELVLEDPEKPEDMYKRAERLLVYHSNQIVLKTSLIDGWLDKLAVLQGDFEALKTVQDGDLPILKYLHECYGTSKVPQRHIAPYLTEIRRNMDFVKGLPEQMLYEVLVSAYEGTYIGNDGRVWKSSVTVDELGQVDIKPMKYTILADSPSLDFRSLMYAIVYPARRRYISSLQHFLQMTSSFWASVDAQVESAVTANRSDTAIKGILEVAHSKAPEIPLRDALEQVLSVQQLQYVLARVYDEGTKTDDSKLKKRVQRALVEADVVIYNQVYNSYHI